MNSQYDWLDDFGALLMEPHVYSRVDAPASDAAIQKTNEYIASLERLPSANGFPPSFCAFLRKYDGAYVSATEPVPPVGVDDNAEFSEGWFSGWLCGTTEHAHPYDSLEYWNAPDNVLMNHEIDTYWDFESLLAFGTDGGGDLLAFDPDLVSDDGEMPVVLGNHESGEVVDVARSFPEFIRMIIAYEFPVAFHVKPRPARIRPVQPWETGGAGA